MRSSDLAEPSSFEGHRFTATFLLLSLLGMGAAALLTWAIDPFAMIDASPRLCGEGVRTVADRYLAMALPRTLKPRSIITGTSRVMIGFERSAFERSEDMASLGTQAASMEDMDALVRGALAAAPVQEVWIGLDYGSFAFADTPLGGADAPGPGVPGWAVRWRYGVFDPHALSAAFAVARAAAFSGRPPTPLFDERGFSLGQGFSGYRPPAPIAPPGPGRNPIVESWRMAPADRARLENERLALLDRLLDDLSARRVRTALFIGPQHPTFLAYLRQAGLQADRERWRTRIMGLAARRHTPLVVADTETFLNSITPRACARGLRRADCLFSDPTHFRPEVGAAIAAEGEAMLRRAR